MFEWSRILNCFLSAIIIIGIMALITSYGYNAQLTEENNKLKQDLANYKNDYQLLYNELFGEQDKYFPECDSSGFCSEEYAQ